MLWKRRGLAKALAAATWKRDELGEKSDLSI